VRELLILEPEIAAEAPLIGTESCWCLCLLYNTIQYNTIQYNTIQYNTIQYNTFSGLNLDLRH
jgi:hypothetical protein